MNNVILSSRNIDELINDIANQVVYKLSQAQPDQPQVNNPKEWMNLSELCEYLPDRPVKQTIYNLVSKEQIPFHKGAKKLRFLKSEIDEWLKGKRYSQAEIDDHVDNILSK